MTSETIRLEMLHDTGEMRSNMRDTVRREMSIKVHGYGKSFDEFKVFSRSIWINAPKMYSDGRAWTLESATPAEDNIIHVKYVAESLESKMKHERAQEAELEKMMVKMAVDELERKQKKDDFLAEIKSILS
jgi:hypothetical protein